MSFQQNFSKGGNSMKFRIYTNKFKGNAKNCIYPNCLEIDNMNAMQKAVAYDHVCSAFKGNKRSIDNFVSSNVIVMDCDNDHSDNPDMWITPFVIDATFPDVNYVLVPSRNNNKAKGNVSARPRFHIYFPIEEIRDAKQYADIKKAIAQKYYFFDKNAIDAARFIFGNDTCVTWHEGSCNITSYFQQPKQPMTNDAIMEGSRNSTLSQYAGKVIKRYGETNEAYQLFLEKAGKCSPPLDDAELDQIWKSAQNFYSKISMQEGYVPPDEFSSDFDIETDLQYKPTDYTDVGQVVVLANNFAQRLRFSPATDFIVYNGSYWEESKEMAQGLVHELTVAQSEEAERLHDDICKLMNSNKVFELIAETPKKMVDKIMTKNQKEIFAAYNDSKEYQSFVLKRRNSNFIASALREVKPMVKINPRELDANEFLLNTPSCTIDLTTLEQLAHEPTHYITKETTVDPSNDGAELWKDTLDTFFCGDSELIDYVQQIVGLAAIGKVYIEALIIAYGEGKNGKSTFWNTIARVLGSYSGNMSADVLTTSKGRNVKPEMAEIKGKRLVIASETEDGQRLSTASIKQLCSTDDIYAEKKYKDPFSFVPSHTLVLYTNHLPKVGEIDKGTWRRLIVIPFDAKITTNNDIKNYADYLYDNAGGAILQWIIEGAKKIIDADYKLNPPARVQAAIDSYKEENDWVKHFIDDCCEVGVSYTERSGELYQAYRNYCARTGAYTHTQNSFNSSLESNGFTKNRNRNGVLIYGLRLKSDFLN